MRANLGIVVLLIALLVGISLLPAVGRLRAEALARLDLARVSPGAAFFVFTDSSETSTNNWLVVFHDANVACPGPLIVGGRIDPCRTTPVFSDVGYCIDQAHGTVVGQMAGAARIAPTDPSLNWC